MPEVWRARKSWATEKTRLSSQRVSYPSLSEPRVIFLEPGVLSWSWRLFPALLVEKQNLVASTRITSDVAPSTMEIPPARLHRSGDPSEPKDFRVVEGGWKRGQPFYRVGLPPFLHQRRPQILPPSAKRGTVFVSTTRSHES